MDAIRVEAVGRTVVGGQNNDSLVAPAEGGGKTGSDDHEIGGIPKRLETVKRWCNIDLKIDKKKNKSNTLSQWQE